jgi:molecular chaperone DnaK
MGRHFDEVEGERKMVSYEVVKGPSGDARVHLPRTGKTYTPQEISAVDIHIMQGERPMAADNMTLGKFRLDGLPQIEVTYDIDANGILNVSARDKATGREQKITITASTNLNKADIERMVNEAKRNEAEDRTLAYTAEKALRDLGDKVPGSDRKKIEKQIADLREAIKGDDVHHIRHLSEELQQATYAFSQQMYATNAQQSGANGSSTSPRRDEGEVVEGEFTEA